ncbi:hypothetical protein DL93DRAFT_2061536 [Clavulina sp. PMI_390]|nr:hypothetical protein DL93DRAFT_2061536 [Clavulina sp. PMI_390]
MEGYSASTSQAPHPFLSQPRLYIAGLAPDVTDADLARAFEACVPLRPQIRLDQTTNQKHGEIDFKFLASAEKALATLQGRNLQPPSPYCLIRLSPFSPDQNQSLPPARAQLRLIKQLPPDVSDAYLFDLFRSYGPIASISARSTFGDDIGVVEYWEEDDAKTAELELQYADIGGVNITIQAYQPRKATGIHRTDLNVQAAPFIPSGAPLNYSPVPQSPGVLYPNQVTIFFLGPGQQVQYAPAGYPSHSGLVDPCNLFCKNLDLSIDSNDLFNFFRTFGQIVSARVMRGDNGQSRGFGFVSYQQPEQASAALNAMNGKQVRGKTIQVRFHEPKQLRQEKLAQRFSDTPGAARRNSGPSSPAISDGGEHAINSDRPRRSSGSYYNAALTGSLNMSWNVDDLQSLSPVLRNDILKGEIRRQAEALQSVPMIHLDAVVDKLAGSPLSEIVQALHEREVFEVQVKSAIESVEKEKATQIPGDPVVGLSALTLSSPQPSVHGTPSSALSSIGSAASPKPEKERLVSAVSGLGIDSESTSSIVELLLTLPKKERALCLFNQEHLRSKVSEAQAVLQADDEPPSSNQSAPPAAGRPTPSPIDDSLKASSAPAVPSVANSFEASADATSKPAASQGTTPPPYTLKSLAALPAKEIVRLANSQEIRGLPLPKADPLVMRSTDDFVDSLLNKPVPQQKQQLGEKLFKVVRAFGVKGAPKLTVTLLDTEDLRALSHLMNSYPTVLKEKVILLGGIPKV